MAKSLSLIHLELGLALATRGEKGEDVMGEMLAVYLAEPTTLIQSRKNPETLEGLRDQAACMDSDEAAEKLSDFMTACTRFSKKLRGFSPEPTTTPEDPSRVSD